MPEHAGIVLAGGLSSRMCSPKVSLAWHGSTLLARVASILARVVDGPVAVVTSPGQALPALAEGVEVIEDAVTGKGPLAGIAAGLGAVQGRCEAAFVSSTDVPFLHPSFVARVLSGCAGGFDICVPVVRGEPQPLAAAYRSSVLAEVESLLQGERHRVSLLFERCATRRVEEAWLLGDPQVAALDPGLESVRNLNHPADYAEALARPEPEVVVEHLGQRCVVRASSLGGAAGAVGAAVSPGEAEAPLVAGDTVVLA